MYSSVDILSLYINIFFLVLYQDIYGIEIQNEDYSCSFSFGRVGRYVKLTDT